MPSADGAKLEACQFPEGISALSITQGDYAAMLLNSFAELKRTIPWRRSKARPIFAGHKSQAVS